MQTQEELFAEYQASIVSALEPQACLELGWSDPALFAAMRGQACVVMTAWNPGFARPDLEVNVARNEQMRSILQTMDYEVWPAECSSPDGQFREPAFLVWDMPISVGQSLAAQFEQFAIYAYCAQGERTVVSCLPG
ncbi:MAG: DUF3293 domain-containing protein [Actinomycetota bacterium]|nr:DUF3293 domain-containing protein [Actinomycetota bacterium]